MLKQSLTVDLHVYRQDEPCSQPVHRAAEHSPGLRQGQYTTPRSRSMTQYGWRVAASCSVNGLYI
jgi:hypothetical protein